MKGYFDKSLTIVAFSQKASYKEISLPLSVVMYFMFKTEHLSACFSIFWYDMIIYDSKYLCLSFNLSIYVIIMTLCLSLFLSRYLVCSFSLSFINGYTDLYKAFDSMNQFQLLQKRFYKKK